VHGTNVTVTRPSPLLTAYSLSATNAFGRSIATVNITVHWPSAASQLGGNHFLNFIPQGLLLREAGPKQEIRRIIYL
jgi:hypothetical protein